MRTGSSRAPWSLMRRVSWLSTDTAMPLCGGTVTDCTTSTPPDGSVSLPSTPTSASLPVGSMATSRTATGARSLSRSSSTSTRTMPFAGFGPAVARYCT